MEADRPGDQLDGAPFDHSIGVLRGPLGGPRAEEGERQQVGSAPPERLDRPPGLAPSDLHPADQAPGRGVHAGQLRGQVGRVERALIVAQPVAGDRVEEAGEPVLGIGGRDPREPVGRLSVQPGLQIQHRESHRGVHMTRGERQGALIEPARLRPI